MINNLCKQSINHDPSAIAMLKANHSDTEDYCESVGDVDHVKSVKGRKVGFISIGRQIIYLTVNPYRRDFNQVVDQIIQQRDAELPKYEHSLFCSCFKNW